jgi:nitrate reductase delta subunit
VIKLFQGRSRRTSEAPDADGRSTAVLRRAAAECLRYPGEGFAERIALVRAALAELPPACAEPAALLLRFCDHVDQLPAADPFELAGHYVQTFDQRNRHALYLSWWTDGDTRNRGASLVRFKELYRAHGLEYEGEDLPDHLCVVLEFAASDGAGAADAASALLAEHAPALRRLHAALAKRGTPYADVIAAVLTTVPTTTPMRIPLPVLNPGGPR